nr:putative protein TPRXL [Ziziphus jujuba var. spinosa]
MAVLCTKVATQSPLTSDVASPPKVSKVASSKDSDAASPTSSFGSKPADEVPETFTTFASSPAVVTESAATESGSFPDQKLETSSNFPSPFQFGSAGPSESTPFEFEIKLILPALRTLFRFPVSGSMELLPEGSNFSMRSGGGGGVDTSNRKFYRVKGQLKVKGKCNRRFYKVKGKPRRLSVGTGIASSTSIPIQFGSTASTAVAPVSAASDLPSSESMAKDTGFGIGGTPFGVTAAATASTDSSIFGFGATATSTADNQSKSSTFGAGSGSMPNSQALSVGTGNASSTSIPIQFGSTTSSPSSGLAGDSISTGSSIFGSSIPAKVFGSGTTGLGSAASPSDTNPISSSSGTPTGLLGTSWQAAKSSIFGSTFSSASPSPGFSFGPSTVSGATTINSSTPFQYGSQLNVPAPQNPSPFPVSGRMGLLPEGSNFSMGSGGGGDKSNRKFYKIKG